jgi:hypothetical protein
MTSGWFEDDEVLGLEALAYDDDDEEDEEWEDDSDDDWDDDDEDGEDEDDEDYEGDEEDEEEWYEEDDEDLWYLVAGLRSWFGPPRPCGPGRFFSGNTSRPTRGKALTCFR